MAEKNNQSPSVGHGPGPGPAVVVNLRTSGKQLVV